MKTAYLTAIMLAVVQNQHELNKRQHPDWINTTRNYGFAVAKECMELADHTNWNWYGKHSSDFERSLTPQQLLDIHVELSDIFHFGVSQMIRTAARASFGGSFEFDPESVALEDAALSLRQAYLEDNRRTAQSRRVASCNKESYQAEKLERLSMTATAQVRIREQAVELGNIAVTNKYFNVAKFIELCDSCGLSFDSLLALYFGKSELNKFRWANGYGDGTYAKTWTLNGVSQEDNLFMASNALNVETLDIAYDPEAAEQPILQLIAQGSFQAAIQARFAAIYHATTGKAPVTPK